MYVLAHPDDASVRSFYSPAWGIVPYTVTDGIAVFLQQVFPLLIVGKIMLAMALLLPWFGMIGFHYAIYRRLSLWILSYGIFSYNALLLLCLYNFGISCGVAFFFAVIWVCSRPRHPLLNMLFSVPQAAFLFLIHLYGAFFYLLIIGSWELGRFACKDVRRAAFWTEAKPAVALLLPAAVTVAGMEILSHNISAKSSTLYLPAAYKLAELSYPWTGYLSLGSAIGLIAWGLLCAGLASRSLRILPGAAICAGICFFIYLASPFELAGAALFSSRFVVMSAMILWSGGIPRALSVIVRRRLALAMIALLAFNIGSTTIAWLNEEKDIEALRQVIAPVKAGSRVLYVTGTEEEIEHYAPHAPFGENLTLFPAYLHFPALLVFEHSAFWPLMLSVKGTMPIRVNPPFDRLAVGQGSPPGYNCLAIDECDDDDLAANPYLRNWQRNFDYVLLLPVRAIPEARGIFPDELELLKINSFAALYRVRHDAS
jgi:hypothetical protein